MKKKQKNQHKWILTCLLPTKTKRRKRKTRRQLEEEETKEKGAHRHPLLQQQQQQQQQPPPPPAVTTLSGAGVVSHLHTCKRGDDPHASLPAGQPSPLRVSRTPLSAPWRSSTGAYRMAAAKTEMILPALQITDPLSFPHSPMDNYPKLEEMMMLSSAGTPFLTASAPEGTVFGSGEPGDHYDHLPGGKHRRSLSLSLFLSLFLAHSLSVGRCPCRACICHLSQQWARRLARAARVGRHPIGMIIISCRNIAG